MSHWRWIIIVLLFSLIGLPVVPQAHGEEIEASIEVLESGVEIMELGSKNWESLQSDAFVSTGDRIRTDETGYALITWFADGTFLEVQPNSELVIEEFSAPNDDEFVIDASLIQGSVFNSVRRIINPESTYKINTSNLTATVRGTVFAVALNEDMHTTVAVVEGTVHAKSFESTERFVPVPTGTVFTATSSADITSTSSALNFADASPEQLQLVTELQAFFDSIPDKMRPNDAGSDVSGVSNTDSSATDTSESSTTPSANNSQSSGSDSTSTSSAAPPANDSQSSGSDSTSTSTSDSSTTTPAEDSNSENNGNNGNGNGGGNGNGNNGNGNGNGGSNGNTNNGNGNTDGNQSGK